ncbi:MAG: 1-deoxy-D-xylulose-5-phosphate synthase [Coprobacillus sp.]|nr:1-deoxy-D-xylulose-5-phosphate synthase [Coprobacillus sp.]
MSKEVKHLNLNSISSPDVVKTLSYKELDALSADIKEEIIKEVALHGGHLSSNLGSTDSIISMLRVFDPKKDKIVFDVGHQCYAYKILTGRPLFSLREKDGVSGFQNRDESPYDPYSGGHSSTSISIVSGMAYARDLNGDSYETIAYIGDASIANASALEGLNYAAASGHKVIIVLNDNEKGISASKGALAKLFKEFSTSTFYIKKEELSSKKINIFRKAWINLSFFLRNLFKKYFRLNVFKCFSYKCIGPVDGHNIKKMEKAFKKAKKCPSSVVVYLKTIKGKGYKYAEEDEEGLYHGITSLDIKTGNTGDNCEKKTLLWEDIYSKLVGEELKRNKDAVLISSAMQLGSGLFPVFNSYPERCIDVGIEEGHALLFGAGLSLSGKHPIISIYSSFLQRAYDQALHDLARLSLSSTLLIDHAGLVGREGESHQGIYDEAFLYTIPNMVISFASSVEEAEFLFKDSITYKGPYAIRYPKEVVRDYHVVGKKYEFGKWIEVNAAPSDTALITYGPIIYTLLHLFISEKKNVKVINALYQAPLDTNCLTYLLNMKKIIIYTPYATKEGFALHVVDALNQLGYKGEISYVCLPTSFIGQAKVEEQMEMAHVTPYDVLKLL